MKLLDDDYTCPIQNLRGRRGLLSQRDDAMRGLEKYVQTSKRTREVSQSQRIFLGALLLRRALGLTCSPGPKHESIWARVSSRISKTSIGRIKAVVAPDCLC
jgi:hypothetical protein